jgi:hypothetical protein
MPYAIIPATATYKITQRMKNNLEIAVCEKKIPLHCPHLNFFSRPNAQKIPPSPPPNKPRRKNPIEYRIGWRIFTRLWVSPQWGQSMVICLNDFHGSKMQTTGLMTGG